MSNQLRKIIQLIVIAVLVKGLGFAREILLAFYYGVSIKADVYLIAIDIPSTIFALFGTAITTTFIPLFSEVAEKKSERDAIVFANNVLNILSCLALVVVAGGIVFSDLLVKLFAGGYDGEIFVLCSRFVKITMITIVLTVIQYIYNGFLQIRGKFNQHSLMNVPYSLVLIGAIIVSHYADNFYVMAFGVVLAFVSQLIYLRCLIKKTEFKHVAVWNFKDPYISRMVLLVAPVFLSAAVGQINAIVDKNLATRVASGSVAAINYSNKVNNIFLEVVIVSIATIVYPTLSRLFARKELKETNAYVQKILCSVGLLIIPLSTFVSISSYEIIAILFERGAFGEEDVRFVSKALAILAFGLIGSSIRDILCRVYYAMQDTITPVKNGMLSIGMNVALDFILVHKYGYLGLVFATMFSTNVGTMLLFGKLFTKHQVLKSAPIIRSYFRIAIATGVASGGILLMLKYIVISGCILRVFISLMIFSILYIGGVFILGGKDSMIDWNVVKRWRD